jgi:hypothetical protein
LAQEQPEGKNISTPLADDRQDFSELVEKLLAGWLKKQRT